VAASVCLPTRCLGVAVCALDRREFGLVGLGKRHRSQLVSLSMSSALSSDQYLVVLALGELGDCCSGTSPVIAGLSRRPPLETTNRSTARPLRQVLLGQARYAGSLATFLPKLTFLRRRTLLLVSDRPAGRLARVWS